MAYGASPYQYSGAGWMPAGQGTTATGSSMPTMGSMQSGGFDYQGLLQNPQFQQIFQGLLARQQQAQQPRQAQPNMQQPVAMGDPHVSPAQQGYLASLYGNTLPVWMRQRQT